MGLEQHIIPRPQRRQETIMHVHIGEAAMMFR